ncbi:MAG TPA: hypothetical protein VMU10_02320, partial [Desulfomonilia bacterium]|nr:hypothetical protein [Desulfomonilia bacterium]
MRNKFVYQTAYVLLAFTLFLNPVNVLSADKTPDAEANMNAYNARTFFDYLMSPFTSIKESSGLASSQYKVVPVKGKILFSSSSNGNAVLYMLSNGIVSEICRNGKDARWSHDGTKFLCLPTGDDIKWSMAIVNDQGKLLRIIKPFENGAVHEACFSPKFQNIIYFKGRKDQYTRDYLYSIDINSNKVTQVSSIAIDSFELSPDGTRIVYSAPRDDKDETSQGSIWIMNVNGSNARKLTD